jgi:hypothetical protein
MRRCLPWCLGCGRVHSREDAQPCPAVCMACSSCVCQLTRPALLCRARRWRTCWLPTHVTWSEHRHGKRHSNMCSVLQGTGQAWQRRGVAAGPWFCRLPFECCYDL